MIEIAIVDMNEENAASIIETQDLTIRFGGHVAVDHVNMQVEPFTLKSIIGPNGAGKTTFFNLLTGQYKPTDGKVFLSGQDITGLGPAMRTRLGMGRSFQLTNIFPVLSVLENVRIAIQSRQGFGLNFWRHYLHFSDTEDQAYEILKDVLLDEKWSAPASSLTHGEQRKLEFEKNEVTIGRVQGNDVILPKGNVSKRHSRIVVKDGATA